MELKPVSRHGWLPAAAAVKKPVLIALLAAAVCASCTPAERALEFPFDHGPHFDARNEWWYFTGEVLTDDGRTIGFETTIFKRFISPEKGFACLGHIAVSLPATREQVYTETVTPSPVTGMQEGVPELQIKDFYYGFSEQGEITIRAQGEQCAVDMTLQPLTGALLHGRDGTITMGDGLPSYYYSFPNLAAAGTITVRGHTAGIVSGRAWMDHQWGNFTFIGMRWDWFSLRLDDGGALMLFRFRDGKDRPVASEWTYLSASGAVTRGSTAAIVADRLYRDDNETCAYPVDWTITIPELDARFAVRPLFDEQAMYSDVTPDYWEGLCSLSGRIGTAAAAGAAYVELTGYCK